MADKDPILDALVRNTEALTNMNAVMTAFMLDYAQGKQAAKEHGHSMAAKLDNLDRSVSELRLAGESAEIHRRDERLANENHRRDEMKRISDILTDERKDRKDITASAGKDERELLRDLIREEVGERKKERSLTVDAFKAIWAAGGKSIVAALALLFVAAVMKLTGMSLADVLGLVGK